MGDASGSMSPPTITCAGRVRAQAEAHQRAGRLAAALAEAGVRPGDRVAMMIRNDIEFLEVSLAVAVCGANSVPIATHWRASEVAHVLADSGARLVIAHTEFIETVEQAVPHEDTTILEITMPAELLAETGLDATLAEPTGRHATLEQWIEAHPAPLGRIEASRDDSTGLIYTSGTTGRPKAVLREKMTPHQWLSVAGGAARRLGLTPRGQAVIPGPLYHASPNGIATLALRVGTHLTIMPRWDAEQFLRIVDERAINQAKVVPTMLSRLLSLPEDVRARYDVSSLTHLIHSSAPCPPAVKRAAIDWFGDALIEYYGCAEAGTITWIRAEEWLAHPGSVGRPTDGAAVLIADDAGDPLPAGQTGQVLVRGADYWPKCRYLHDTGEPDCAIPGFLATGDRGYLDEEGYLYLTGRTSEVIVSGGVHVYPAEIENAIMALGGVEDVAVFGVAHPGDLGEAVAAHILPRPGAKLTEDGVRAGLAAQLAAHKVPRVLRIVAELPRDEAGKIHKRRLRARMSDAG
ncbi:long-chain acyl-CoA synthetase [Nocardia tenerifensis]|uniref:Long-chain acyl-CoA synthetase n=1 Tax=Nocardia tenerifensis TaxID=228006 RepID=A0A318K5Y3_9NOCA|nr:AMP-binding protein [Nocardia tenerifensis]PXX58684.1 long-chain acyl-CoA synthetase [Nocardia tenerifensis]